MTRTTFYLGTHRPHWLADSEIPLFVSRRRLDGRKSLPRASAPWVLDSGGYTELATYGGWGLTVARYAAEVRRYRDEIGNLAWAAPMDWMCEPNVVAKTGLTVWEHQKRTIENALRLWSYDLPIVPVLQGWTLDDYLRHIEMYEDFGHFDIMSEPLVAVGSICRRGQDDEIVRILDRLRREGLTMHAFGVRSSALERAADCLASADSMAWSYTARRAAPMAGHSHKSCSNCRIYAEAWYERQVSRLAPLRLAS